LSSIYYLTRGISIIASWTPQGPRHALGSAIGAASYLGWPSKRWVTQLNMAQVTGRPVDDRYVRHLALASWRNYGRYAADFMNFSRLDIDFIEQHMRDLSQGGKGWQSLMMPALQAGRGAIVATAHFGNWDMAGAMLAHHQPFSAVAETFSDERLNQLVQDQRREKGIGIIPMEGSARRILRVLQQNQLVAIVVDRPVTPDQGTEVTFFGRKTYVPSGPAALALKSGAPILPGYVWYGHHNGFYTRLFPPIFPRESKGVQKATEIARLTQSIYDTLEEMVREWPTQWYMFRQFWPSA
jgi:phosphatidylinositol dimannoside acyltransferase